MADYASRLLGTSEAGEAPPTTKDYAADLVDRKEPASGSAKSINGGYLGGPGQAVVDTAKDIPAHLKRAILGVFQGATDIPVGLAQLGAKFGPKVVDNAVNDFIKNREAWYQDTRGDYSDRADVGRLTGSVVASMPAGGGAAAATIPARMAQGAKIGSVLGAAGIVDPESENFVVDKAVQIGSGAAAGASGVPVAELAVKAVGATVNAVSNFLKGVPARATNKATQDAVEQTLTVELKKNGVNFADLSKQARDALILETQKALKSGGAIDPDAVGRIADFSKLDMQGTQGQVSRDPYQFSLERNIGKTEAGKPLARRFDEQNRQLITAVDTARADTGSAAGDAYDVGKRVIGDLRASDDSVKSTVDAAYTKARDEVGRAAPVNAQDFSTKANLALDEGMLGHYLPPEVKNIMNDVASGKIPFNVDTMVRIDQVFSAAQRSAGNGTPQALAIGKVRDALNAAPIESNVGEEAKRSFDAARELAKQRFKKIENIPALADMLKNKEIPPEDFVNNYVIRGTVDDVKTLMSHLPPGARRDVRASVIDWLKAKAVNGADEAATFSQSGFNKAIDTLGERNLRSIFSDEPEIVNQLRRIGRVAAHVQKAPVSSGVNYSSSATAVIDMLDKFGKLPVVGALVGKPSEIATATQVSKALTPPSPTTPAKPLLTLEALENFGRSAGLVAAPGAASWATGR